MNFRQYDALKTFKFAADLKNFSAAADQLNITKGAVSYQIKTLEHALGFELFIRLPRGVTLTPKGQALLGVVETAFGQLDQKNHELREINSNILTIGVSTYFASRWLSPRLMEFMHLHPDIRLRIQPMINFNEFAKKGVDLAIRWGFGDWQGSRSEELFKCPAFPVGNAAMKARVEDLGLEQAFSSFTLFSDREESTAWADWFDVAGLIYRPQINSLIIPDPNVRVQAVIDGQGVALNDPLVLPEIEQGRLYQLTEATLAHYGYHMLYADADTSNTSIHTFADWIKSAT